MTDDDGDNTCPVCECTYKDARRLDTCVSLAVGGISRVCVDTHTGAHAPMSYYHTAAKIS